MTYVVRLKVLPKEVETGAQQLFESIAKTLGPDRPVRLARNEPIAFGLYALTIDIVAPEQDGAIDAVEAAVAASPMVGQSELQGVSRQSSTLRR